MMRALFSGVAGLKTHQTKMDVIGNNIANVNTVGYKASSTVFSDVYYQTTQAASGPNGTTGGTNAMQIGLGSQVSAISKSVDLAGGSQTTNNALDVMITGKSFFITKNNQGTSFTRDGAFTTDAAGNLVTADGAYVQGWMATKDTTTNQYVVNPKQVENLSIMSPDNSYSDPEATTAAYLSGNIDKNDTMVKNEGRNFQINFFDKLGYQYTAKFKMKQSTAAANSYYCTLTDVVDSAGNSIFCTKDATTGSYELNKTGAGTAKGKTLPFASITLGSKGKETPAKGQPTAVDPSSGALTMDPDKMSFQMIFNARTGTFVSAAAGKADDPGTAPTTTTDNSVYINISDPDNKKDAYESIQLDLSKLTMYANSSSSSIESSMGDVNGNNKGCTKGTMTGCSIDKSGKIYGNYDNGRQRILAQIAITTFKNPGGLESTGGNYFQATQNSGEFDGIGKDITADGGKMSTGMLEMSNVDLAGQFTDMITTQRGFQANSRIITVSDTLLEELVNLKR